MPEEAPAQAYALKTGVEFVPMVWSRCVPHAPMPATAPRQAKAQLPTDSCDHVPLHHPSGGAFKT